MPAPPCERCKTSRSQVLRPKNRQRLCAPCFIAIFEAEVAETITTAQLFKPGERIAIGASGGKDSTVLASVLTTLNTRHNWQLDLQLLSIDEGITGYRDHSLDAVRRNASDLDLPLTIVSYADLYGWSMDQVVAQIGKKGNCTYCGVFRRQALDRGSAKLGVAHVVTGHNADDVAETVLMNLLRGDLPRLSRATSIVTSTPSATPTAQQNDGRDGSEVSFTDVKRSKPLMYAYEKEIVLYAHHRKLDYFSTECIYSPEAFRGSARTLIKNLERIRPESILDVVRSGVDMARLVPGAAGVETAGVKAQQSTDGEEDANVGGCGSSGTNGGNEMAAMEKQLREDDHAEANGTEIEIKSPSSATNGQDHDRDRTHATNFSLSQTEPTSKQSLDQKPTVPVRLKRNQQPDRHLTRDNAAPKQKLGQCERCGYLSSQAICKACVLLEGLNKARPRNAIEVNSGPS